MAATTIKSTMTPASNQTGQTVAVRQFKITDIPDAMKKIEWPVAAELMLKWFDGKPWSTTKDGGMEEEVKGHHKFAPDEYINENIVKMSWALQFDRAKESVDRLRTKWNNPAAINLIKSKMKPVYGGRAPGIYPFAFNGVASAVERFGYANSETIEFEQSDEDEVNELRAALANFNIHVFAEGEIVVTEKSVVFLPNRIGFYIEDSYDFNDALSLYSQGLGYWNFDGIEADIVEGANKNASNTREQNRLKFNSRGGMSPEKQAAYDELGRKHYMLVQNSDFQKYRQENQKGGDFRVYSDVLYESVSAAPIEILVK
ncbi:hypothetical protein ASC74_01115 [Pseudomonas sp. Root329]|uniref:DUF6402 family protein n=1 Tax=Pseudomonas sp. Root329 TaxID=1736515 RepID=UPI0006F3EE44|nr:DUF6402 family protein [Pseudomonas sp. Root329]KQV23183.1 hypothetical protein ASC74_01115 [Pseudomonas sp. Root329]